MDVKGTIDTAKQPLFLRDYGSRMKQEFWNEIYKG